MWWTVSFQSLHYDDLAFERPWHLRETRTSTSRGGRHTSEVPLRPHCARHCSGLFGENGENSESINKEPLVDVFIFLPAHAAGALSYLLAPAPRTAWVLHCAGALAGAPLCTTAYLYILKRLSFVLLVCPPLPQPELFPQRNSWDGPKVHSQQSGTGCGKQRGTRGGNHAGSEGIREMGGWG